MKFVVQFVIAALILCPASNWANNELDALKVQLANCEADTTEIRCLTEIAARLFKSDKEAAFDHVNQAIELALEVKDSYYLGLAYESLGRFYFGDAQYARAIEIFLVSEAYYKRANHSFDASNVINSIGLVYVETGNLFEALTKFSEALEILEELGDQNKISTIYLNMGVVYHELEYYDMAAKYYHLTIKEVVPEDKEVITALCNNNLGEIALARGQYLEAKDYFRKSIRVNEGLGNISYLSLDYANLGMTYTYLNEFDSAQSYLDKSLIIGQDFNQEYEVANTKNCLAQFNLEQNKYDEAIVFATECLNIGKDIGALMPQKKAYNSLYLAHRGKKDFEKALIYNLEAQRMADSLARGGDKYEIAQIESSFNAEEKILELEKQSQDKTSTEPRIWEQDVFLLVVFFILLGGLVTVLEIRQRRIRNKRGEVDYGDIDFLKSTRILYLIAGIFYTAIPIVIPDLTPDRFDPFALRVTLSVVILTIYLSTYLSHWVRQNIDWMTHTIFIFMVAHHFYLIYVNKIALLDVFCFLIILAGVTAVFRRFRPMFIFMLTTVLFTFAVGLMIEDAVVDNRAFIAVITAMLIVGSVVSLTKSDLDRHLEYSTEVLNQADALVFIVNRKGENVYTSQSVKNILGHNPLDFKQDDWIEKLGVSKKEANRIKNNLILIAMGIIQPRINDYQALETIDGKVKWLSIREKRLENDRVLVIGIDVTERKIVEDELANSERNFRQISETLADVFYLYNITENKWEYISPNSAEIMGPPPEFFYTGKNHVKTFVLEEDRQMVIDATSQVRNGQSFDIEYRMKIGNDLRWIREKSFPVKDETGKVIKNSGICQDITERKNAEQEIERLSLVASNTDNFILMVNHQNRVEWANQSFYNLTGYTEHETIGKLPLELISGPLTSELEIDRISRAIFVEQRQMQCELTNYTKELEIFYSRLEVTPLIDKNGELDKYFVIGADITQSVEDRSQIEKLSLVASNTSNYVIIAHADNGIEWVNEAFTEKFGYEMNEVLGKYPSSFLHGEQMANEIVEQINEAVFTKKAKFAGEVIHQTKSGEEIYGNVDITPIISPEGNVEKYFVLGVDISERKRYEEQIKRANHELSLKERALNESEQSFRQLIKSINGMFWLADGETDEMIFVSESYQTIFGKSVQSLKDNPTSWRETIHPEDFERVVASMRDNYANDKFNEDFRIVLDSGEEKWVNSRIFGIYDTDGKMVRYSGFVEDITVKKHQEIQIAKIADRLDVIHAIEKTILTSESTADIIYNTLDKTLAKLPILRASLALFNPAENSFYSYSKMTNDQPSQTDGRTFNLSDFSSYETLNKNRANHIEDLTKKETPSLTDKILIDEGAKLALMSPLIHGGELIGSLNVCFTESFEQDTTQYTEITNEVANGLAIAIQQSKLKDELAESNASIKSSIDYAKMIQQSYIPFDLALGNNFTENFIINHPKDIVSGDFYWVGHHGDIKVIAVGDCTGHGVPGAFMTVIGISELNNIVNVRGITDPGKILEALDKEIVRDLSSRKEVQLKDGMDVAIVCLNTTNGELTYAGARRPLYYFSNNELKTIKGTKLSIGYSDDNFGLTYATHKVDYNPSDTFYLFSDGCTDQFGGERRKKFTMRRLSEEILKFKDATLVEQKTGIETAFMNWRRGAEQTDDILFVGFKLA